MTKIWQYVLASSALWSLSSVVLAQDIKGISFTHGEWELYCSNTGTCRAAGYNAEDGQQLPASILLTRKAGANQPIRAEIALSDFTENFTANKIKNIRFYLNGKDLGEIGITDAQAPLMGILQPAQTQALLQAAKQSSSIIFKNNHYTWRVADQGMTAALLKMDDFQKRIGTTGAIIRKGTANEANVLKAQPPFMVTTVKTTSTPSQVLTPNKVDAKFRERLLAALPKDSECDGIYNGREPEPQALEFFNLTNNKVLVKTLCWRGAYNEGYGIWVLDGARTAPKFITESASDFDAGVISSSQKGRGIGDCWASEEWVWNGQNFIKTKDRWSGMCKGLAAGGVWELDLIESKVK